MQSDAVLSASVGHCLVHPREKPLYRNGFACFGGALFWAGAMARAV